MSMRSNHPQAAEINRIAGLLIEAWAKAEPNHGVTLHPTSYVATFADMARAVVEDALTRAKPERDALTMVATKGGEIASAILSLADEFHYNDRRSIEVLGLAVKVMATAAADVVKATGS